MSLFKKKNCCCDNAIKSESCSSIKIDTITSIKVLGTGCKSCHQQYANVQAAVKNLELNLEVDYITDLAKIMEYSVMSMPAIVANKKVISMGKVLSVKQVEDLLKSI